jgi:mevalonate kinase
MRHMRAVASAPGKVILFGEHAVVYQKPAIAIAVDKRVTVKIQEADLDNIRVEIPLIDLHGDIHPQGRVESWGTGQQGMMYYIRDSLHSMGLKKGLTVEVDLGIPIGAGLGSSAAVTVATMAAALTIQEHTIKPSELAHWAHQVELNVQGSASPMDTAISTHGGAIYLSSKSKPIELELYGELPLAVAYTNYQGNTGELVTEVKTRRDTYPEVVDPILDAMEMIARTARHALEYGDEATIADLMNINHGLLDALGVNTPELSRLVYYARRAGALASKITGAGGGGSIVAFAPGKVDEVVRELNRVDRAFPVGISREGVVIHQ